MYFRATGYKCLFVFILGHFRQLRSIWIYCMRSWLIMLIICVVICNSGKLGGAGQLGLAALLELIARSISKIVCLGLLKAWDPSDAYFGWEGQTVGCFSVSSTGKPTSWGSWGVKLLWGPQAASCPREEESRAEKLLLPKSLGDKWTRQANNYSLPKSRPDQWWIISNQALIHPWRLLIFFFLRPKLR